MPNSQIGKLKLRQKGQVVALIKDRIRMQNYSKVLTVVLYIKDIV